MMPRIAPPGAASGLILSGDPIDADQALRWGIIHRVVAPEELDDTVLAVAERLAVADPAVAAALKRSIRRGLDLPMSAAIRRDTQTARRLANRLSDR